KINYTGTGNLTLVFNQENRLNYGSADPTYFQVYKDTAAAAIYSQYYYSTSGNINLTGLAKGYYYIKVFTYYTGIGLHFSSYSITNTFTQINTAKVTVSDYVIPETCSPKNSITFNCIKGQAPYTVQLYRFGVPYGDPVTTNRKVIFKNLPEGLYYAHGFSDGATGTAFAKSKTLRLIPTPKGLNTTNILVARATLNWKTVACAAFYSISYSEHNSGVWTTKSTDGNVNNYLLKGLSPNTMYDWTVASVDTANKKKMIGQYADSISFTTAASFVAGNDNSSDDVSINTGKAGGIISIAPNPAISYFIIHYNTSAKSNVIANLYDVNGKAVWTSGTTTADVLNGKRVMVNQFGSGLYYLKIVDAQGAVLGTIKVAITK
ncbi:MAG: T9SS type A sorting domain-containing protein, partial [Parafilimonas sp.]